MLTGCLCEVDTHTRDREEVKASLKDEVNCIGGDISPHSRGKEHLLLQAADVNIALCVCGSVASDGVRIEAKKTGDTPAKLHPSNIKRTRICLAFFLARQTTL